MSEPEHRKENQNPFTNDTNDENALDTESMFNSAEVNAQIAILNEYLPHKIKVSDAMVTRPYRSMAALLTTRADNEGNNEFFINKREYASLLGSIEKKPSLLQELQKLHSNHPELTIERFSDLRTYFQYKLDERRNTLSERPEDVGHLKPEFNDCLRGEEAITLRLWLTKLGYAEKISTQECLESVEIIREIYKLTGSVLYQEINRRIEEANKYEGEKQQRHHMVALEYADSIAVLINGSELINYSGFELHDFTTEEVNEVIDKFSDLMQHTMRGCDEPGSPEVSKLLSALEAKK